MAKEHSVRVSARGEFGQLERGLKNLQKDLNSVLGEIDKGARRGGVFDETQLRALSLYRARFKETMGELNKEFEKQNEAIEKLHRAKEKAYQTERNNIDKQIKAREKELDVIRRQIIEMEKLYGKRTSEASDYTTTAGAGSSGKRASETAKRDTSLFPQMGGMGGGLLGAGKFALGLGGLWTLQSLASQAYQKAYESQVTPMDLSQRIRGQGYGGSAKDMWDTVGNIGRSDQMGYTSQESWQFMDVYSRQAGAMSQSDLQHNLKFGRAYGLDVNESANALADVRELGGATSTSEFADMIARSVDKTGMTPRILEVMQTSAGLLSQMNTTLKDTGAKQILAYQTTLDQIGQENGMMKLTGQQGANIISGLGGIYSPQQSNDWKWLGIQALQQYDPGKYGDMDLYGLERTFEDGLMNEDNLPAMASYLREASGGDESLMKRMLQRWLQDGGYNATKTQVDELYGVTDGLKVFDEAKMEEVMKDLSKGDGTAKYQERMGQLGQNILDTNARFEKQLENIGQPLLEFVQGAKEMATDFLEWLTGNEEVQQVLEDIRDFLKDNWGLLATLASTLAIAKALAGIKGVIDLLKPGGKKSGDKDSDNDDKDKNKKDKDKDGTVVADKDKKDKDKTKNPKKVPPILGWGHMLNAGLILSLGGSEDKKVKEWEEKHKKSEEERMAEEVAKGNFYIPEKGNPINMANPKDWFASEEERYKRKLEKDIDIAKAYNKPELPTLEKNLELLTKHLESQERQKDIRDTKAELKIVKALEGSPSEIKKLEDKLAKLQKEEEKYQQGIPSNVTDHSGKETALTEKSLESLNRFSEGGQATINQFGTNSQDIINKANEHNKSAMEDMKNTSSVQLAELVEGGQISLSSLNAKGASEIQKLVEKGLINLETLDKTGNATILGFSEEGKAKLEKLKEQGMIDFDSLSNTGITKITALNEQGIAELKNLDEQGNIKLTSMQENVTSKVTKLSEDGAKELLKLQSNGSVSLSGMSTDSSTKLSQIKTNHKEELKEIKGEHTTWKEKALETFTEWKDGFGTLWDKFIEGLKDLLPAWLGGGDSTIGKFAGNYEGKYSNVINKASDENGIDPYLIASVIKTESNFDPNARSHAGAMGLMQLMPGTARSLGVTNAYDPEQNVMGGSKYLAKLVKRYDGNVEHALTAYNWGEGNMDAYLKTGRGMRGQARPKESLEYAQKVMANYQKYMSNMGGGNFFNNWQNRVTSRFGSFESFRSSPHGGLDINGEQGDALQAIAGGKISFIKYDDGSKLDADGRKNTRGGGTELGVKMANGETYFYSHLSAVAKGLKVGDTIQGGQYLGNVGGDRGMPGSGSSTTGSHLHLGYLDKNGYRRDPEPWLKKTLGNGSSSNNGWFNSFMGFLGMGDSEIGMSVPSQAPSMDFTNRSLADAMNYYNGTYANAGDSDIGKELPNLTSVKEVDTTIGAKLIVTFEGIAERIRSIFDRLTVSPINNVSQTTSEVPESKTETIFNTKEISTERIIEGAEREKIVESDRDYSFFSRLSDLFVRDFRSDKSQLFDLETNNTLTSEGKELTTEKRIERMVTEEDPLARIFELGDMSVEKLSEIVKEVVSTVSTKPTSEVQKHEHTYKSTIDVNFNVSGEGADQLNNATLVQLARLVKQIVAEDRKQQLSLNPTRMR